MEPKTQFGPMTGSDLSGLFVVIMLLAGPPGWLILVLGIIPWAVWTELSGRTTKAELKRREEIAACRAEADVEKATNQKLLFDLDWRRKCLKDVWKFGGTAETDGRREIARLEALCMERGLLHRVDIH